MRPRRGRFSEPRACPSVTIAPAAARAERSFIREIYSFRMSTLGQRIAVVGVAGSGKTTVARALTERLGYRYIDNDAIVHGPDWQVIDHHERIRRYAREFQDEPWVIDGNCYPSSPDDHFILANIDTLVWIDLPRRVVWPQLLGRTLWRAASGQRLWHGNRETWRKSFASRDSVLLRSVKTYASIHRQYEGIFATHLYEHITRIRLHSRGEVARWLASVKRPR